MSKKTEFSKRLSKIIFDLDMSPKELSEKSVIPYSTILGYLNNGHEPTLSKIKRLCETLNVSADWLIGLKEGSYCD